MHALLNHTAVQAILVPFLLALLTAELLQRMRLSGLAIIAGFAVTVYLVSGFGIAPLNSTRKIIWLVLASGLVGISLNLLNWSLWRPIITLLAASAAVWVVNNVLQQHATATALQWGAGCALYAGWLAFWMDDLQDYPVRAASAGMALGLGTGIAIMMAGATLFGKFDLAVGAAAAAFLFIMFVSNSHLSCGRSFTLPLSLLAGMTGSLVVLTGKLPWYTLAVLALIPLAAKLPASDKSPVWIQATLLSAATLACALGAVYLSWRIYGWTAF